MDKKPEEWKSVLVVDDDESHLKLMRGILLAHSYSVLAATTGEEGLHIAKAQKPDLILLDVILPGIKGRDVCRTLKADEETKDIPVVFLTAKDSDDDIQAEQEVGGVAHLTKPIDVKTMLAVITDILPAE